MNADKILSALYDKVATWGVRILGVLLVLFIAWLIAGWARSAIERSLSKREFDATLTRFFANLARYAIIVLAALGCLGAFGIQTTSVAAVIGAAGLAIGLAFQGTLSNFAAGVMLLIFRPFKVGEWVKISGEIGGVEEIDLFTTTLKTADNRLIFLPNKNVFGNTIENLTTLPTRRVDVPVGVDYAADIDETREVLMGVMKSVPEVLDDPEPQAFLKELGASSVDWVLRAWVKTDDYWSVHQELIRLSKKALDEKQIGIPFPQVDVHLDKPALDALQKKTG